jgi:hypothetical protein
MSTHTWTDWIISSNLDGNMDQRMNYSNFYTYNCSSMMDHRIQKNYETYDLR